MDLRFQKPKADYSRADFPSWQGAPIVFFDPAEP
jgi:hypothetical protein